jgi:hypothetical protein
LSSEQFLAEGEVMKILKKSVGQIEIFLISGVMMPLD